MPQNVLQLDDKERLVASHLSIPRPVLDISNQVSVSAGELGRDDLLLGHDELIRVLDDLEAEGLVKNLGNQAGDARRLISLAAADPDTIDVHDDKVETYSTRLEAPNKRWRTFGEQWMLTKDGVAALDDAKPGPTLPLFYNDEVPALEGDFVGFPQLFKSVAEHVANEHKRVWYDAPDFNALHQGMLAGDQDAIRELNDPANGILHRLMPFEFDSYLTSVTNGDNDQRKELVDRLGLHESYRTPRMQGGAGWADATESLIVDAENGKGSYAETATTALFMQLIKTTQPTDTDTAASLTQVTYTGYAAKAIAAADMNSASTGSATNANAITWPGCTAGTDTAIATAKTTVAATAAGRLVKYNSITSVTISTTQTPPTIAVGSYTTSAD